MPLAVAVLHQPLVAYGLLVAALAGLLYAAYVPAAFVPGFAGCAAGLLALLAFLSTPPQPSGLALLCAGVVLMNAEFLMPTFGLAGGGGIAAAVWGSWRLLEHATQTLALSGSARLGLAGAGALVLLAVTLRGVRKRTLPQ